VNRVREALIEQALSAVEDLGSARRRAICEQPLYRGVSMPQIHILIMLIERGPMTVSELAALLSISAPSASSILDRMEENGLVKRERDEVDRRVVHVDVTTHGRGVVDGMMGLHRDFTSRLLQSMSDEDLQHVVRAVEAVRKALGRRDEEKTVPQVEVVPPVTPQGPNGQYAARPSE
jgi:DNA-binding MarR family transcriptional regulator